MSDCIVLRVALDCLVLPYQQRTRTEASWLCGFPSVEMGCVERLHSGQLPCGPRRSGFTECRHAVTRSARCSSGADKRENCISMWPFKLQFWRFRRVTGQLSRSVDQRAPRLCTPPCRSLPAPRCSWLAR